MTCKRAAQRGRPISLRRAKWRVQASFMQPHARVDGSGVQRRRSYSSLSAQQHLPAQRYNCVPARLQRKRRQARPRWPICPRNERGSDTEGCCNPVDGCEAKSQGNRAPLQRDLRAAMIRQTGDKNGLTNDDLRNGDVKPWSLENAESGGRGREEKGGGPPVLPSVRTCSSDRSGSGDRRC